MKKGSSDRLTRAQQAEIEALAALPDDQIDTREIVQPDVLGELRRPANACCTSHISLVELRWIQQQESLPEPRRRREEQLSMLEHEHADRQLWSIGIHFDCPGLIKLGKLGQA